MVMYTQKLAKWNAKMYLVDPAHLHATTNILCYEGLN